MQAGKSTMASMKETAANIGASAKSGMDKTKAVVEEKMEKMTAHHPAEKEIAERRKEEKVREAETRKQEAKQHNAAAKEQAKIGSNPTASSPVPGPDRVVEGAAESRPIGLATGTERLSAANNPYLADDVNPGGGTGARFT